MHSLNILLANYQVHYQKLRNYHWNVTGGDFFDIHEKLELQYNEAQANIDLIAERVRVFHARPLSTYAEYLEASTLKEDTTVPESDKMMKNLLADYVTLVDLMCDTVELTLDLSDSGTERTLGAASMLGAGLSIPALFGIAALLNAVVAIYIYGLVPEFLLRFIAWLLIRPPTGYVAKGWNTSRPRGRRWSSPTMSAWSMPW